MITRDLIFMSCYSFSYNGIRKSFLDNGMAYSWGDWKRVLLSLRKMDTASFKSATLSHSWGPGGRSYFDDEIKHFPHFL